VRQLPGGVVVAGLNIVTADATHAGNTTLLTIRELHPVAAGGHRVLELPRWQNYLGARIAKVTRGRWSMACVATAFGEVSDAAVVDRPGPIE
jgi:hypothetical protein